MSRSLNLDPDLLEALLANEPEYSWEEQASAPIPPVAPPPSFLAKQQAAVAAISASATESGSLSTSYNNSTSSIALSRRGSERDAAGNIITTLRHSRRAIVRANPKHSTAGNWTADTFPFNYKLPLPPSLLTPLLVLKAADPLPRSSVITSPYLRIPSYNFCARTSANWRMTNVLSLRSRCHLDHLPFFSEHEYDNESEFRDRIAEGHLKLAFHIPSEEEKDQPLPPPSDEMCAICLVVGCIMHRTLPHAHFALLPIAD